MARKTDDRSVKHFVKRSYLAAPRLSRQERRRESKCWRWCGDARFDPFESDDHRATPERDEQ